MTCHEFESFLMDHGGKAALESRPVQEHLEECLHCREMVSDLQAASQALQRLRAACERAETPAYMESKLLQEFRRAQRRDPIHTMPKKIHWMSWAVAAIVIVGVMGLSLIAWRSVRRPTPQISSTSSGQQREVVAKSLKLDGAGNQLEKIQRTKKHLHAVSRRNAKPDVASQSPAVANQESMSAAFSQEEHTDFISLQPDAKNEDTNGESLVRVRLPASSVAAMGVPVNPINEDVLQQVTADVVVDQFGTVHAIRFVKPLPVRQQF